MCVYAQRALQRTEEPMNRRLFLVTTLAGGAIATLPGLSRATAPPATPEPDAGILTIRWELQQIASGRRVLTPDDPTKYWLQVLPDGTVAIQADCNQAGGTY